MDILSSLRGLTFTLPDLYSQVATHGWEVKKVKHDAKTDRVIATAKHPETGEELDGWGPSPERAVSNLLFQVAHRNHMRSSKVASWSYTFTDLLVPIAEAYSKAPIYEPKAAHSFMELARDSMNRARAIGEQISIQIVNDPEPYKSPDKMYADIRKRRQLIVSRAGATHPLWSQEEILAYRVVHDVLGYAVVNAEFDWEGENQAFAAHASVISAEAQPALFTESIAQTAYATYYRSYGPQKVCLLSQFIDKAMESENPHKGFRGIHPSQMFLPGPDRKAKPPHKSHRIASDFVRPMANGRLPVDINAGWQSNQPVIAPYDQTIDDSALGLNSMEHMISGNGLSESDPNFIKGLHTDWTHEGPGGAKTGWNAPMNMNEADVKKEWETFAQQNPQGAQMIRQAVSNAIRVVCLSPKTLLHQNAQHYQDLANVPHGETDPNAYWNALENARQDWNAARFGDQHREDHRPWHVRPRKDFETGVQDATPFINLARTVYDHDPSLGQDGAKQQAQRMINEMKSRFHDYLLRQQDVKGEQTGDEVTPLDQRMWIIDNEANKMVIRWIKMFTDETAKAHDEWQPAADEAADEIEQRMAAKKPVKWPTAVPRSKPLEMDDPTRLVRHNYGPEYEGYDNHKAHNLQRYGAFMGSSLQTIALLSSRLDDIVVASLEDVHAHDATGHHFRTFMLSLNAPGVGPKIISFMWLLLQPLTTQLATIDVHMSKVLGYSEKDVTDRDYFRMERELAARRDSLGLNHVPLGQFQWATWDMGRTGGGTAGGDMPHQDHSFMRVVDPTPAWKVKILPPPAERDYNSNPVMQVTQPAADNVVNNWKENEARQFPAQGRIPTQAEWPAQPGIDPQFTAMSKTAAAPWIIHPQTGEKLYGVDGQTIMQHLRSLGLNTEAAWNTIPDEAAGKV